MRWARHVACTWKRRSAYRTLGGNLRGIDYVEYLGVEGRIILRWIFGKWNGEAWTGLIWLRIGTVVGPLCLR
jgi:hypothetical protein